MARTSSYATALRQALAAVDTSPADGAAVRLATGYAKALDDDPDQLDQLGPKLLATLTALAMTPAGRAAILGKGAPTREPAASPLDELRARRAARAAG
jgi:hypothetical protein